MKRKALYALGLTTFLGISMVAGWGCGEVVQTSGIVQQEAPTTEEESTTITEETGSEEESTSVPENVETEEAASSQANETEETVTLEETVPIEELKIIEMDAVMYATTTVNIRKESSTDAEKIGGLFTGEKVHVTGRTEDGLWYRVDDSYKGEGFIAAEYLTDVAPVKESAPSESTQSEAERQAAEEAARKAEEERQAEEQRQLEEAIKQQEQIIEENQNIPEEDLEPAPESTYQPETPTYGGTGGGNVDWSGWSEDGEWTGDPLPQYSGYNWN